jgi:predicted nucleic acid-binding protein
MLLVFLDSGPLGLVSNPHGRPPALRCREWVQGLATVGVRVFVPEVADYEVRRELARLGATAGIRRLDRVMATLEFAPITREAMLRAAELWAEVRRGGRPTAGPGELDGDCILAAQALSAAGPDDQVIVATANLRHLARFVDARPWEAIEP